MHRFKMSFENNGAFRPQMLNRPNIPSVANIPHPIQPQRAIARLNDPMVERVHKARPGCSACGKKVA
jgi:hypothetical protein